VRRVRIGVLQCRTGGPFSLFRFPRSHAPCHLLFPQPTTSRTTDRLLGPRRAWWAARPGLTLAALTLCVWLVRLPLVLRIEEVCYPVSESFLFFFRPRSNLLSRPLSLSLSSHLSSAQKKTPQLDVHAPGIPAGLAAACARGRAAELATWWLAAALTVGGLGLAAARRAAARSRHGIGRGRGAGGRVRTALTLAGDVAAWLCCPACAACQEARTAAAGQCEGGVWGGGGCGGGEGGGSGGADPEAPPAVPPSFTRG
jgi:hypothetical protein